MEIFNHPSCNHILGAPADMQEDCSALPVTVTQDEFGIWSTSFWKPTPAELERLNSGGTIAVSLRTFGRQHPVMSVNAAKEVPNG